jgi:hypothetical protein
LRGEVMRRATWLPLLTTKEGGFIVEQVVYYEPYLIAAFCASLRLSSRHARALVHRYVQHKMGRASNTDVVTVAISLIFTVARKPSAQLASVTVGAALNTFVFQWQARGRGAAARAATGFGGSAEDKGEHD